MCKDAGSLRVWLSTMPPSMLASRAVASARGGVRAQLALLAHPFQRVREQLLPGAERRGGLHPRALVALGHLGCQRPDRAPWQPHLLEPRDKTRQRLLQPGQGRDIAQRLGQPGQHLRAPVPHGCFHQLVPAAKIVIQLALARARRRQHFIQARPRDPALSEQVRCALHDPLAAGAPAPGSRLARHVPMLAADCTRQSRADAEHALSRAACECAGFVDQFGPSAWVAVADHRFPGHHACSFQVPEPVGEHAGADAGQPGEQRAVAARLLEQFLDDHQCPPLARSASRSPLGLPTMPLTLLSTIKRRRPPPLRCIASEHPSSPKGS